MPDYGGHTIQVVWEVLHYCTTCCGAESSMPTECPGEKMTAAQSERVMASALDFRDGRWVIAAYAQGLVIRFTNELCQGIDPGAVSRWERTV